MDKNEKTVAIAERDRAWAELRDNGEKIAELLKGKKELEPFDFILFYQCITIILTEIVMSEKELLDVDESTKALLEDRSIAGSLLRTLREAGYWKDMVDNKLKSVERLEALAKLRKSMWANMAVRKEEITTLMSEYPELSQEKMHTLMQCVAMVALELDLRTREIELMY